MHYKLDDLEIKDWYLLAKLIHICCESSEGELKLNISDTDFENMTRKLEEGVNYNQIDFMMKNLGDTGVIEWFASSIDDGFKPDFQFVFNKDTFRLIRNKLLPVLIDDRNKLLQKIADLENELKSIYKFDPKMLNENIIQTNNSVNELLNNIKNNEHLKSLEKPVAEFTSYLESIRKINNIYQDIFTHIVRPIQEEGEKGVKATAKWAIISIVIATLFSVVLTNWDFLKSLIKSLTNV